MLTDNFVSCDTKPNVLRATKLAPSQSKRSMRQPVHSSYAESSPKDVTTSLANTSLFTTSFKNISF